MQPMMSTENLLGEPKEAEHFNPRSLKKSIQIELERHALENIKFGLAVSVMSGVILFLLAKGQPPSILQWAWLSGIALSALIIWLWMVNSNRSGSLSIRQTGTVIVVASSLFAILWGLAAPLFINPQQLETSALTVVIIATLGISWPLNHAFKVVFRHLFLSAILAPLPASLYIFYPQIHPAFLALIGLLYALINRAVVNHRDGLIEATGNMLKATQRSQQIITTSPKIQPSSAIPNRKCWGAPQTFCLIRRKPSYSSRSKTTFSYLAKIFPVLPKILPAMAQSLFASGMTRRCLTMQ
jgi:hypothetical protein